MWTTPTFLRLVAVLTAVGLVGSACSSGDGGEAGPAEPQYGGALVYAVEADTLSPWVPAEMVCAAACQTVTRSVYDHLVEIDADGRPVGYLLETWQANGDYTEWELEVRDGIEFHDGTPLDGEAVAYNIEAYREGRLGSAYLSSIRRVRSQGMTVTVEMSEPFASFPYALSQTQGFVASPRWLRAVEAGEADPSAPVGTGPFVFESYESGRSFTAVRNENYWIPELPYLDEVKFEIMPQADARVRALIAADVDVIHTSHGDSIERLRGLADEFQVIEHTDHAETNMVQLNNSDPTFQDPRVRTALAMAIDRDFYAESRDGGVAAVANGPFPPGMPGHLDDTGYPAHDPELAATMIEEYEAENGPVEVNLKAPTDISLLTSAQLIQSWWREIGVDTTIDQLEQSQYIASAALGDFQAFIWRQYGNHTPDLERHWWSSEFADDEFSMNFARIDDPVIDENLSLLRATEALEDQRPAAEEISRRFGEQRYLLWLTWAVWTVAARPGVHGFDEPFVMPDGTILELANKTNQPLAHIWVG